MSQNDWKIGLLGGLDGTKSRSQLNSDIKGLARNLDKLKIYAELDPNQAKQLQNQLKKLEVELNNITVSDAVINGLVKRINDSLQGIQITNIGFNNVTNQARNAGQQIGNLISNEAEKAISNVSSRSIGRYFRVSSSDSNEFRNEMEKLVSQWTNAKGKLTDVKIDTRTTYDKDAGENIERLHQATVTYSNELDEVIKKTIAWRQIGTTTNAKGEEEILRGFVEVASQYSKSIETANQKTDDFIAKRKKMEAQLSRQLESKKKDYENTSHSRPIASEEHTSQLSAKYEEARSAVDALGNATKENFVDAEIQARKVISELNDMVKAFRDAERVQTSNKSSDITSAKAQAVERFGKLKANSTGFDGMADEIAKLDGMIEGLGDKSSLDKFIDELRVAESMLGRVKAEAKKNSEINLINSSIDDGTYESKVDNLVAKTQQWTNASGQARISTADLEAAWDRLAKADNDEDKITYARQLETELKKTTAEVRSYNAEWAKDSQVSALHQRVQEFYDKNSATHRKWGAQLKSILEQTGNGAELTKQDLQKLSNEFINIGNSARQAGKLGQSFWDKLKSGVKTFTQWTSATSLVMKGWQITKDMIQNVREFDDSLLELVKVSDLSAEGLEKVADKAYDLGERVGRTGKQVVDAVTEFKRAGFELNDSMDMAESALVMTNVAEGIDDTADAAGTLISVLKGYNMSESETMSIVDKINQVSNTSPIGFDQIAEGLERTAGTMAQSGTTIDETIGLITAGYAQLRNVEKVSTSLITLSARLRGVDENGDVIDGLSAELQDSFGKIGVAIEDADGNLRSIYAIAKDYAEVLPTLSSKQKQYYAELAAGKRNVTTWNAITQQFQDAEHAVAESLNSVGSAAEENEKYLNSVSGKVTLFESAVEDLSNSAIDSDFIKFIVDLGTTGVKNLDRFIETFGMLGTTLTVGGIAAGIKNFGRPKMFGLKSLMF